MNPEQRTVRLPFTALVAIDEPLCSTLMLTTTHNMLIRGWIWWTLPFPEAFE
jgi:hypothetical protein